MNCSCNCNNCRIASNSSRNLKSRCYWLFLSIFSKVGILLGLAVGIGTILINSYKNSHFLHIEDKSNGLHAIKMEFAEEVTFLNKAAIQRELYALPKDTYITLINGKQNHLTWKYWKFLMIFP